MELSILKSNEIIKINKEKGLRVICGENTVIHCHHYNARIQNTIEGETSINGKSIIRGAAEQIFQYQIKNLFQEYKFSRGEGFQALRDLYSIMGYGDLSFDKFDENFVYSTSSHYVSGWQCGSVRRTGKVCTMTEGYISAALLQLTGDGYDVEETECMNEGCKQCQFTIKKSASKKITELNLERLSELKFEALDIKSNINKQQIIDTVITLPIYGNELGLIPMFNVYLANTPQTFYSLISINYLDAMAKNGKGHIAEKSLINDAEFCAMNTFSGILDSDEWASLIAPMVKEQRDKVFGLLAIANAMGWGKIFVKEHPSSDSLVLASSNGYEGYGFLQLRKNKAQKGQCFMLSGVAAGLMSLIYQKGNFSDRLGIYQTSESRCMCWNDDYCEFPTHIV